MILDEVNRTYLRKVKIFSIFVFVKCGNSSVGRASPCQGECRGFESRFPLEVITTKIPCFRGETDSSSIVFIIVAPPLPTHRVAGLVFSEE
jgi:hypothetical protein